MAAVFFFFFPTHMHVPFAPLHGSHAALSTTRNALGTDSNNACARLGPPPGDGQGIGAEAAAPRKSRRAASSNMDMDKHWSGFGCPENEANPKIIY